MDMARYRSKSVRVTAGRCPRDHSDVTRRRCRNRWRRCGCVAAARAANDGRALAAVDGSAMYSGYLTRHEDGWEVNGQPP